LAWVRIYLLKPSQRELADLTEREIFSERERGERSVAGFNSSLNTVAFQDITAFHECRKTLNNSRRQWGTLWDIPNGKIYMGFGDGKGPAQR
jgi:hypothetical protein